MSGWAPRVFWSEVTVVAEPSGGWGIRLDGRPIKTPLKRAIELPSEPFAEAVAAEWRAQEETVDPKSMPWTRAANAAIDKVAEARDEVLDELGRYGGSDLLCYRADGPESLIAAQAAGWDPLLAWVHARFGAELATTSGIMPVAQSQDAVAALTDPLRTFSAFALVGVYDLVALSGSLVLALAVIEGELSPEDAWERSRIDETWQIAQWGADEEAAEIAALKRAEFLRAAEIVKTSRT